MKASIIIPAYNEEEKIANCISSLLKQSFENFEIIIIDDGSIDNTRSIVKKFSNSNKNIRFFKQKHGGPGKARNLGARNAFGKVLVFVDADMEFDTNYVRAIVEPILDKKHFGTWHNKELVINQDNIWALCWGVNRLNVKSGLESNIFRAISKDIFLSVGGFDPSKGYFDDQTLFQKLNKHAISVDAICYHHNPDSISEIFHHSKWVGRSFMLNQKEIAFYAKKHFLKIILGLVLFLNLIYLIFVNIQSYTHIILIFLFFVILYIIFLFLKTKNIRIAIFKPVFNIIYFSGFLFGLLDFFLKEEKKDEFIV